MYEFKMYIDNIKTTENLDFHAIVFNDKYYEIVEDMNNLTEELFLDVINGKFEYSYLDENDEVIDKKINKSTIVENLREFSTISESILGLYTEFKENIEFNNIFYIRYVGSSYSLEYPMLESVKHKASEHIHKIKNIIVANNKSYKDDFFETLDHGSLKVILQSPNKHNNIITLLNRVVNDISSKKFDKNFISLDTQGELYREIYNEFCEIAKMKKLEKFYISIDNKDEIEISDINFLKAIQSKLYSEDIEIIGNFKYYNPSNKSFKIHREKDYSCHLSHFNFNSEEFIKIKKLLDSCNEDSKLKVIGEKTNKQTIKVLKIEKIKEKDLNVNF